MAKAKLVLDKLPTDVEGRVGCIIAEFRKLNHTVDESPENVEAVKSFAAKQGFDLLCVAKMNTNGVADYEPVGIELALW